MSSADSRAIVIGASLAGLLAARVLAEHFDEVLLLERGDLPANNLLRRATPHTRHAHGLLARGKQLLESLFPGIVDEWVAAGGTLGDFQDELTFMAGRQRFATQRSGIMAVAVGRGVIEGTVRRRVLALPQVRAITNVQVEGLTMAPGNRGVTGVRCAHTPVIEAALVIDASGRASRLPQWLSALGYAAPKEEIVEVDIRYATAYLEREPHHAPGREVAICAPTPDHPYPAVIVAQEGRRWVVTLGGYAGDPPPLDRAGFIARAQRHASELAATVADATFVCEPFGYRFPHSQRRRYERLQHFPQGLLAIGDAICSFNPIYGQGMTVAACEAEALGRCLRTGPEALAPRFFKQAARSIDTAWATAVGADLSIPAVRGARPLQVRLVNRYIACVFEAAQDDAQVARAFLEVAHLLKEPPSLMRPAMLWRVASALWRRRAAARTASVVEPREHLGDPVGEDAHLQTAGSRVRHGSSLIET